MSDPDFIDPNKAAGEIVKGAMDSESCKSLFGPMLKNVGMALGDLGDVIRFYSSENLNRLFPKWAQQRDYRPLDAEEFKRVLPLLRDAAMVSDDELQDRWAALLDNTAIAADGVLPSFGQTLSQLTPSEARYLDRVFARVTAPTPYNFGRREGRVDLSYVTLVDIYNPKLRPPSPAEMRIYEDRMSPEQLAAYDEMTNFELMLHDLERLNLIGKQTEYVPGRVGYREIAGEEIQVPGDNGGTIVKYALTQYGVSFILAVRPKQSRAMNE
jgi:hypothetical protein